MFVDKISLMLCETLSNTAQRNTKFCSLAIINDFAAMDVKKLEQIYQKCLTVLMVLAAMTF